MQKDTLGSLIFKAKFISSKNRKRLGNLFFRLSQEDQANNLLPFTKIYPTKLDVQRFKAALGPSRENTGDKIEHDLEGFNGTSRIKRIFLGAFSIKPWYNSPYPEEYCKNHSIYICEYCLKYMSSTYIAWRHKNKCCLRSPPGNEIFRYGNISIFEVDGRKQRAYCQNICLLAKMFLQSKALYYDVEPFLFYVLVRIDPEGSHFVGYFSKEKKSALCNNVSCILTLPIYQRKGYGQFLIEFSYLLSKQETVNGSPEKPLSDLGLLSYRKFWKYNIAKEILKFNGKLSISKISNITRMTADDTVFTLEALGVLYRSSKNKEYLLVVDKMKLQNLVRFYRRKGSIFATERHLKWTPYE